MAEILRVPIDRELSQRARWLITFRWLVLTVAIVFVLGANLWLGNVLPVLPLLLTITLVGGYNLAFWHTSRRFEQQGAPHSRYVGLVRLQIITDLFALTCLLHFSGAIENPFSLYYVLIVLVGSMLMAKRDSYLYAAVASAMWLALLVLEATGILPHYNLAGFRLPTRYQQLSHIVTEAFVIASGSFAVAYLSSSIIERLRVGEQQLLTANASCELRATELSRLNDRLRELDAERAVFIRLVTHELRAPVAAIQSYLRLILEGYVPEERLPEIVAKAEQRAKDQLELIADLLDLARLGARRDAEDPEPCDLVAVLTDVMDMMQARIADKGLDTQVDTPDSGAWVQAHEEHVRQVWINLVSNAIKYTPAGGSVRISVRQVEGVVRGVVTDTGIGIAPEEGERIFETFFRTEAAKEMSRQGTGLGLAIVRGIVERYGGRVWLESEVGVGSVFRFELPCAGSAAGRDA